MCKFRPLGLLNNDYKLFVKILAMRLEGVVPSLVHFDQVGFVKGRYASSNMRRLFHVMRRAATLQQPAIEWPYLFYTLERYGIVKYLGINRISPIEKIFKLNGPKLIKTIREDLTRWGALALSLWGRAEIIKMNVFYDIYDST